MDNGTGKYVSVIINGRFKDEDLQEIFKLLADKAVRKQWSFLGCHLILQEYYPRTNNHNTWIEKIRVLEMYLENLLMNQVKFKIDGIAFSPGKDLWRNICQEVVGQPTSEILIDSTLWQWTGVREFEEDIGKLPQKCRILLMDRNGRGYHPNRDSGQSTETPASPAQPPGTPTNTSPHPPMDLDLGGGTNSSYRGSNLSWNLYQDPSQVVDNNVYAIFISYRYTANKEQAELLYYHLRDEILKRRPWFMFYIFLDIKSLSLGEEWRPKLFQAVRSSCLYVPILSSAALDNFRVATRVEDDNFLLEMHTALEVLDKAGMAIVPVSDEPFRDFQPEAYISPGKEALSRILGFQGRKLEDRKTVEDIVDLFMDIVKKTSMRHELYPRRSSYESVDELGLRPNVAQPLPINQVPDYGILDFFHRLTAAFARHETPVGDSSNGTEENRPPPPSSPTTRIGDLSALGTGPRRYLPPGGVLPDFMARRPQ